jgi:hypothetical protein
MRGRGGGVEVVVIRGVILLEEIVMVMNGGSVLAGLLTAEGASGEGGQLK